MNKFLTTIALLGMGLFSGISAHAAEAPSQLLTQSQTTFAIDLYAKLGLQPGNLFFSPYSIATALEMVFVGANGETEKEIAKTLHLNNLPPATLLQSIKEHNLTGEPQKDAMELCVANALWGKEGYPFNPAYIASIKDSFGGNLTPVDFNNEPASRAKINGWVSNQTNEKIQNLIAPGVLNPQTSRLVLTNAIYFKAAWAKEFEKRATQKQPFHVSAGKDVDADMMRQVGRFRLATLEDFRLLTLPYKNDEASMLILLPNEPQGLAKIEASLTTENLSTWIEKSEPAYIALSLPKIKNTSTFNLKETLKALGMNKSFDPDQADFTSIANVLQDRLYISEVIHKAFIDADETGTEAAAATAIVMLAATAALHREAPQPFIADHPFLYIIRANRTGDILFMGRLVDPSAKGA